MPRARQAEAAVASLDIGGRLGTLGGSGEKFTVDARTMVQKELELIGSRYGTRQEVIDSLALVARGEIWPVVSETLPLAEAQAMHDKLGQAQSIGRGALTIG